MRGMIAVIVLVVACGDKAPEGPLPVDEVVPRAATLVDKTVKVHGWVVAGSIEEKLDEQAQQMRRTFAIQERNATLRVQAVGPMSDLFKDNAEFVYTGTLRRRDDTYLLEVGEMKPVCPKEAPGAAGNWCVAYSPVK
jgi:cytochrome c-type biogenesis protein CcmE